jgi:hypothetical protein
MLISSTSFTREWRQYTRPDGSIIFRPVLPILVRGQDGFLPRYFLVDSGADLSMAPYELFRELGRRWQDGEPITLRGISRRKVCMIRGRIHEVEILIPDAGVVLPLPMVFARGNAPFVLGREGFFDFFNVTFEKVTRRTVFQFLKL